MTDPDPYMNQPHEHVQCLTCVETGLQTCAICGAPSKASTTRCRVVFAHDIDVAVTTPTGAPIRQQTYVVHDEHDERRSRRQTRARGDRARGGSAAAAAAAAFVRTEKIEMTGKTKPYRAYGGERERERVGERSTQKDTKAETQLERSLILRRQVSGRMVHAYGVQKCTTMPDPLLCENIKHSAHLSNFCRTLAHPAQAAWCACFHLRLARQYGAVHTLSGLRSCCFHVALVLALYTPLPPQLRCARSPCS